MPVIALTQGMGSLAQDIAEQLAKELQLSTLQHEVTERVASKMHVSKSLISRLRAGRAGPIERLTADRASIEVYSAEEVLEAAARGHVVLRGWGATCLLRPVAHVPCVRILRPLAKRVQWLMAELDTDDAELAEAEIRRSDNANASRMQEQFGVNWGEPVLFDLVLNTDRMSVDTCVGQIKALVARPEFAPTESSRAMLQAMALQARVRSALRASDATHDVDITIDTTALGVRLRGIVLNAAEHSAVEQVAAAVPGVGDIDNQLRLMTNSRQFSASKT